MAQKYICAGRCPELDINGDEHCKCTDPATKCPHNNQQIWVTLAYEIGGPNERTCNNREISVAPN